MLRLGSAVSTRAPSIILANRPPLWNVQRYDACTEAVLMSGILAKVNIHTHLDVDAQRRFRENNKTLWLVVDNGSTNAGILFSYYLRTLVRIP